MLRRQQGGVGAGGGSISGGNRPSATSRFEDLHVWTASDVILQVGTLQHGLAWLLRPTMPRLWPRLALHEGTQARFRFALLSVECPAWLFWAGCNLPPCLLFSLPCCCCCHCPCRCALLPFVHDVAPLLPLLKAPLQSHVPHVQSLPP
jgi:hypothetical protein